MSKYATFLIAMLIGGLALAGSACGTTTTTLPHAQGEAGESCTARVDCVDGLACLDNRCVKPGAVGHAEDGGEDGGNPKFTLQSKRCVRVQCEVDKDCCESFVAPPNCPTLQMNCAANMGTDCAMFKAQCKCTQTCQANLCVNTVCKVDTDCGSAMPHCLSGMCGQCKTSTDCAGPDQQCVSGVCLAGCVRNEQCPLFSECQMGECVATGCKSARECYIATRDPLSECRDGMCTTACTNDAACGDLQICVAGQCEFVGCETDDECRVQLDIENDPRDRAVCREPDH